MMKATKNALLLPAAAILCGYLHYSHVSLLHERHLRFSYLSNLERELSFRTEMGFYYSYYKQLINNDGFDFVSLLLRDNSTEYPDTINAFRRFNLYPEVGLALVYRGYIMKIMSQPVDECYNVDRGPAMPPVVSCEGLGEPAIFYTQAVFVLAGFQMTGFFLLAYVISNQEIWTSIVAVAAFFFHHEECTRVMWTPPLRESFSYPFFVWEQLALCCALQQPSSTKRLLLLVTATVLFLLPWQFAQFVVLLQSCALFGMWIIFRVIDTYTLRRIFCCFLVAGAISSALQFGNTMLLTSYFPAGLLAMLALSSSSTFITWRVFVNNNPRFYYTRVPVTGILLLCLVSIIKRLLRVMILTIVGGAASQQQQDDTHIMDVLLAKFNLRRRTFDTMLYLCAEEFGFYDVASLRKLWSGLVLPSALGTVLLSIKYLLRNNMNGPREGTTDKVQQQHGTSSSRLIVLVLLQLAAFSVLAGLIMRFKLFFTPQLILTAGLLFHRKLFPFPGQYRDACAVALIVGMAARGVPNLAQERSRRGQYVNYELEQLVEWIQDNTHISDPFIGPMTIMATVRLTTGRPIYNHPHYENAGLRVRTRNAYALYSRKSLEDVWSICGQPGINVKYAVFEKALCYSEPQIGCRFADIWDTENPDNSEKPPLCELILDESIKLEPFFKARFENDEFILLEVL